MATIAVDPEIFTVVGRKLIVVMSQLAEGFSAIATELESGTMPIADVARMVRELEQYASAMAKEMSL